MKKRISMISKSIFALALSVVLAVAMMPSISANAATPTVCQLYGIMESCANDFEMDTSWGTLFPGVADPGCGNFVFELTGDDVDDERMCLWLCGNHHAIVDGVSFGDIILDMMIPGCEYAVITHNVGETCQYCGYKHPVSSSCSEYYHAKITSIGADGQVIYKYYTDGLRQGTAYDVNETDTCFTGDGADAAEVGKVYHYGGAVWTLCPYSNSDDSGSGDGGSGSGSSSAHAHDMATVNIAGSTLNTWEEIVAHTPDLTAEKLHKANHSDDALLHVNIVGKDNKTVPVAAVTAMDNSTIEGLHVFIGEGDAITFFNVFDNTGYTGKNFTHKADITETEKVIEFEDTGKLNTIIAFHTLILPNRAAKVYKVVDGVEVFVGSTVSIDNGGICFAIDELTKYIIRY